MSYDFECELDRRHSTSIKWNWFDEDVIPMWVADMDFKSPEPITQALVQRAQHGVFGYEMPSKSLREAVVAWLQRRHQWTIQPDDLVFLPGLVSGLNLACRAYGHIGDSTAMLMPVYGPFHTAPENNGMQATKVTLSRVDDGAYVDYRIDFDALERALTSRTRMLLHCHPHNPIGKEFSPEDTQRLAELCLKRGIVMCSDEIHGDLMLGGTKHVPTATLSPEIADNTITLMAPSKTFNVPGLGISFAVVQNARLRQQLLNAESGIIPHVNAMGLAAAGAAFTECDGWLDALWEYLTANRDSMLKFVAENMPGVRAVRTTATYLGWLDFGQTPIKDNPAAHFLKHARVAVGDGAGFGPGGEGFIRLNFGCPRPQLMQALERMAQSLVASGQ